MKNKLGINGASSIVTGSTNDVFANNYCMEFNGTSSKEQCLICEDRSDFNHQVSASSNKSKFTWSFWHGPNSYGTANGIQGIYHKGQEMDDKEDADFAATFEWLLMLKSQSGNTYWMPEIWFSGTPDERLDGAGGMESNASSPITIHARLEGLANAQGDKFQILPGGWNHICVVYDGTASAQTDVSPVIEDTPFSPNRFTMYVNGVEVPFWRWDMIRDENDAKWSHSDYDDYARMNDTPHTLNETGFDVCIGALVDSENGIEDADDCNIQNPIYGLLDEVAHWQKVALTKAQVQYVYNMGTPGNLAASDAPGGLQNWWRFEEDLSDVATDTCTYTAGNLPLKRGRATSDSNRALQVAYSSIGRALQITNQAPAATRGTGGGETGDPGAD